MGIRGPLLMSLCVLTYMQLFYWAKQSECCIVSPLNGGAVLEAMKPELLPQNP